MDLYDVRGGRLGVITEEAEHQESNTMERGVLDRRGRVSRDTGTLQRFSVDTDQFLHFEPCEDAAPSPTGAEDGYDDDVFKEKASEVGTATQLWPIM